MNYISIFIGGGLGAVCRFFISSYIGAGAQTFFPTGTLFVNLAGSFMIGLFFQIFQNVIVPAEARMLVTVGFLGGFTTFSTFSLETMNLLRESEYRYLFLNIILNNIGGLVLVMGGIYLGRIVLKLIRQV